MIEDILISTITKILLTAFLASLCMFYMVHGIPGIKRILILILISVFVFKSAGIFTEITILSIGYKGNNPFNIIREKWNLLIVPQKILNSGEIYSDYYIPDFSIFARRNDFAIYCAIIIILTFSLYYRAKKVYSITDLEKPLICVVEKVHPLFIFIVSCIVSVILAVFVILGRPQLHSYYDNKEQNTNSIYRLYHIRDERIQGTVNQGYFKYYSFQIYDMESNGKIFIMWCSGVASGVLAGAAAGKIILKGRRKKA